MPFIGYSKADNDPKKQGMYNYAWKSNSGLTKSNILNQNLVASRPKKRKSSIFLQSPWHKVYLQGSELCHSISISEKEWSLATNMLCEKVGPNEAKSPSERRLVLSTHLMQQLLQPAPAFVFLGENAALNYEIVLYFMSRLTLADSCSLKCRSDLEKSRKHVLSSRQTSKTASDQQFSSLVNASMEKIHKLESDFQSLERTTTSILDIIFEIQDLERFSVINHLGKFHNRAKTITRPNPQRYVVGIQMPTNLPEPLHCLPL
ncbi:uncharacterized protein LOC9313248 isoform X1 [Arabidopsis lyrata subsp. lyrata]|uniref:uncharacterized protein LOC9313248 isoform X1 n=1 Tax=Arabidopsis lyrata subsp. lyrata TaxID=81972 RepID=UPI000A29D79E|nr:uncharacterized protein LOC9313248 isoform X1 [Arabidopsis lyrata subsp. lyrata]XP_020881630.1 uncharacterized protein LOC9313248 isoform X1 [Arabidopsis lyrata subsp. lyrata]|eukprot:XP_020881629.1 uncharacterized protein LOC9313248 isoform X1 [Arabidopsis lyrata subsp. lyrata]